ncbi:MAG: hypothetical protein QF780_08620 [Candidatus Marinimicrobia bacterium]|jgi:hypothetical protein|nr:hypothetical protein [Candidatus Neomarinimicrobiota bacterium]|tara:strand:- start:2530 stop:3144 length:615 start_codon:yes stop_codon:yes gene_type:complete
MRYLLILQLLFSIVQAQRIQLFTRTDDIFTSSNHFTLKNKKVIFWEDEVVLMTVPIRNLVEVRYAEKSYSYVGTPCIFLGSLMLAATAGLGAAGHLEESYVSEEELLIGVGGGIAFYLVGKLLKLVGARFGSDIIYEDFDRLDRSTKNLVLESISLDMQKKEKQSEFMYGPEGRKRGLKFSWEGKKPWKSKYRPKRKIIRFSFF